MITFAYAAKNAIEAGQTISVLHFTYDQGYVNTTVTVQTQERSENLHCQEIADLEILQEDTHSWDEGVVTTPATETESGVMTYTCIHCGQTRTEEIPAMDCPSAHFTDVNIGSWYHKAVDYVLSHNIMHGTGETTFAPTKPITRAELAQLLYSMSGSPEVDKSRNPFTDVQNDAWYSDAVLWANQKGIVHGKGSGIFDPQGLATRQEVCVVLYGYANAQAPEEDALASFEDAAMVASWAQPAMNWAVASGIINGSNNCLYPASTATRAEMAKMIMSYCESQH